MTEMQRSDERSLDVLAFSGSLRAGSYNTLALKAAQELAPPGMRIRIYDIGRIPFYNEDVRQRGFPPEVQDFRQRIEQADAILIATPEYNFSIPGVLKNAIDWASRRQDRASEQPFNEKPAAIMGATRGIFGTTRAQYHLRQCCVELNMYLVNKPEVTIREAQALFDDQGRLTDETTRAYIQQLLVALDRWTRLILRLKEGDAFRTYQSR